MSKHKQGNVATAQEKETAVVSTGEKASSTGTMQSDFSLLSRYRGALMGFASLWILFFHEWVTVLNNHPIGANVEGYIKAIGFCGVDIFLMLSGIGLVFSISKKSSLPLFYYKRLKRIILPFLAMAILRCSLEKWPIVEFFKNISGVNFYTKSIYSFLWFLPAIMTLYLLFPLYYKLFSKSANPMIFTFGAIELWLILTLWVKDTMRGDMFGFTNRIPIFLLGVLFGWLIKNKKIKFTKTTWVFFALMVLLGGYLSYLNKYKGMYVMVPVSDCCFPNILMSIGLCMLLVKGFQMLVDGRYTKIVGKGLVKVLAFFGTFSLEFYCVQEWLGGRIITKMFGQYPNMLVNLAVLASVTAVAFVSHIIFTKFWVLVELLVGKIHTAIKAK